MADRDETFPAGTLAEPCQRVRDRLIGEVDPADDARDEPLGGGRGEELPRLLGARSRLHEDGSLDARRLDERAQVVRPERATDRGELVCHPRVVGPAGIPEVMVGVDHRHAGSDAARDGTGAAGSTSPSARRSAQRASGIGRAMSAG